MDLSKAIQDHYGPLTAKTYDHMAKNFFWGYKECLQAVAMEVVYARRKNLDHPLEVKSFLDLGVGTGNLSEVVISTYLKSLSKAQRKIFTQLKLTATDLSLPMLAEAQEKLSQFPEVDCRFKELDIRNIANEIAPQSIDCIISSFAIHHLSAVEKKNLFTQLYELLVPGGFFVLADRMKTAQGESQLEPADLAVLSAQFQGVFSDDKPALSLTMQDIQKQFDEDGDQPSSLDEQMDWLKEVGFKDIRKPFYSFGCAVISAAREQIKD